MNDVPVRNDLDALWMGFTANRDFKRAPRLLTRAEGMEYTDTEGRLVLDAVAGLWCVNAGHGRPEIAEAVGRQLREMDYAPPFQMAHPLAFETAARLTALTPDGLDHAFFCNSGSEAVETALKIALAYHRMRGEASRTRLIGRERGYHGVNFGGTSVGGVVANRRHFGALLAGVDHLPHTHDLSRNAFSVGQPAYGAELADVLERLCALHDPSTIAAVIVEPVAGSTGVLIPPLGYLERLREITARHGILLIFDEVISGFGRLGAGFAAERFGVTPDLITCAKGLTNGAVPMGAVIASDAVYQAFMTGPEDAVDLFHGYTYSSHPVACAAALATMDIYAREDLFARAGRMERAWSDALHSLRDLPCVIDIRALGLVGAVEFSARPGRPGTRGFDLFKAIYRRGVLVRPALDAIALSPPLIIEERHIAEIAGAIREAAAEVG